MMEHVKNAESLFSLFLLKHNIPLPVFDHAENLFQVIFSDFKTAQREEIARNKNS